MKKFLFILTTVVCGCTSTKVPINKKSPTGLYEVLTQQSQGGASIKFFEILTEESEIAMLKADENLSGKISSDDLKTSTFLILNMGEKPTGGFSIEVSNVQETPEKIIVTTQESSPDPGAMVTMALTYPYTVVKINSKKEIEIR